MQSQVRDQIYMKGSDVMRKKFCLFLLFVVGGSFGLSAQLSVSPRDPAFLDQFNDSQKKAIHHFLGQESGKPKLTEKLDDKSPDNVELKKLYTEHLSRWCEKLKIPLASGNHVQIKALQELSLLEKGKEHGCSAEPEQCSPKVCCENATPITAEDIGCRGFTIRYPGSYCLNGNEGKNGILLWRPAQAANVITIDADNVTLDLNKTTIIQKSSSTRASTAIRILPGHKNIKIYNGALVGFTADALVATSTTNLFIEDLLITENRNRGFFIPNFFFGSINILSCLNVNLQNITVSDMEIGSYTDLLGAGILLINSDTFTIKNCEVVNGRVDAGTLTQCLGISTILCENGVIENCRVSHCHSSGIMPAFGYVFSQNILSKNCIANYNTGRQTTSGYYPQISDSLQFINCEANNNLSTCQDCHGFPYFISTNGFFSGCRALNNFAVNPTGGFNEKCTGFEILVCRNCIVEKCDAYNNSTTNPIRHYAAGFANGNSTNVVFRQCISIGNNAIGNSSRGVGFGPALDPRFFAPSTGTVWENCIAEGNFGDVQSLGFDLFGQIGAILTGSISQNHGSTLFNNGVGILSDGPYDEGNPVDVPCNVVPVVVITQNAESHVLVRDNTVANNSFIGIMDTTSAENLYMNNVVFNNGTNFVGTVFTTGTPIRSWTVTGVPSPTNNNGVTGDNLDNLNAIAP